MPTTKPRHQITETDELAAALRAAANRWPGLSRSQLVVRLALEGHRAAQQAEDERRERRLTAIRSSNGKYPGAFPDDHLSALRVEWPE